MFSWKKAINNLGLNPMTEGNLIRIPPAFRRRRKELSKVAANCRKF